MQARRYNTLREAHAIRHCRSMAVNSKFACTITVRHGFSGFSGFGLMFNHLCKEPGP